MFYPMGLYPLRIIFPSPFSTNTYKFTTLSRLFLGPLKSTIPSPFQTHLFGSSGSKGGLSKIYNMLLDISVYSISEHHFRWEQELSAHFSTLEWERASTTPLKLSRCINHTEMMRKIHLRWYLTPVRTAYMFSASSPLCWRKCGQVGTLLHGVVVVLSHPLFLV